MMMQRAETMLATEGSRARSMAHDEGVFMTQMTCDVAVKRLPHAAGLELPAYETEGSAGMDLRAAIPLMNRF